MNFHKVARALVPGVRHQALSLWFTEDEIPEAYQKDVDEKGLFGLLPNLEAIKISYPSPFIKYWDSICKIPKLKKLEITLSAGELVYIKDFGQIQLLEELRLHLRNEPEASEIGFLEHIWQLPNLEILSLSGYLPNSCLNSIYLLSKLKHFKLFNSQTITYLPPNLSQCVLLESLTFEYLYSAPEIPDTYQQLSNLKTLIMRNVSLEVVPDWLSKLPNLKSLNLYDNAFPLVPASVLFCPHLEELRVSYSQTPFADEQAMQKFIHFLRNPNPFWAKKPMELVDILYKNVENVATKPNIWFLELMNTRLPPLPRQTVDWLEQKYAILPESAKDLGANSHLSVLSLAGLDKADLQERLKAVGIAHNFGKILPKTTHALVGSACKFDLTQVGIDWEKLVLMNTAHLFEVLNRKEGAFLTHGEVLPEQSEIDNLAQLINLENLDLSCLEIAYQLLDKGGIPQALLTRVVIFCLITVPRGKFGEMHQKMKKLALRHLPNAFKTLLNRSSLFDKYKSNQTHLSNIRPFLEAGKGFLNISEFILTHAQITSCLSVGCELLEGQAVVDFFRATEQVYQQKKSVYFTHTLKKIVTGYAYTALEYECLEVLSKVPMRAYLHDISQESAENNLIFWEKIALCADNLERLCLYYQIHFPTNPIIFKKLKILDLNCMSPAEVPDWVWTLPVLEYIVFENDSQITPEIALANGFVLKTAPADCVLYKGSLAAYSVQESFNYFQKKP